ncbi:MAG: response regulator [Gemmatimonadetes bacterium]|nr:response regulator [Gemmatimonadota bacterium]
MSVALLNPGSLRTSAEFRALVGPRPRSRWYVPYFAMVLLNMLALVASVSLGRRVSRTYRDAVTIDRLWAQRLQRYAHVFDALDHVAASVAPARTGAPGAQVRRALEATLDSLVLDLRPWREEVAPDASRHRASQVPLMLDSLEHVVRRAGARMGRVLSVLERERRRAGPVELLALDQALGPSYAVAGRLMDRVQTIQNQLVDEQYDSARTLQGMELAMLVLVVVIAVGLGAYGYRLWRELQADAEQRERLQRALLQATEDLEARVAARTAELEQTHQQLRQAQKMEAVGQLAGGMAHDFNNLLTTVLGAAELVADELPSDSPLRADLEGIQKAARRGASLTGKLLAFSRRQRLEVRTLDLSTLLADFTELVRRLVPESIEMRMQLAPSGTTVRADAGAVEQILMNLVTNACDAMPEGGTLVIETARATLDQDLCARRGWGAPGPYVVLAVRDTGVGMDEGTRRRVFEPFFTTKPPGEGTGLGLAMVYGLVKQQEGFVHLESQIGHGTTVTVYLPLAAGAAEQPAARPSAEVRGGTETILLVEDDPALRRVAERALRKHGYRVVLAADGEEALQRIRSAPNGLDLLLTDVVMPRLGGPGLLEALRTEGKAVRALMTSGYPERGAMPEPPPQAPVHYLAKPWTVPELLRAVRAALDGNA